MDTLLIQKLEVWGNCFYDACGNFILIWKVIPVLHVDYIFVHGGF